MIGLLIVDDEEGVRRSLQKALKREWFPIYLAANGAEALDIAREKSEEIETVISDYKMPGIDGLETLAGIERINPEITRIMLTGYATMETAIESVNSGIDGFLTKPFSNIELRSRIKEYNLRKRLKQFVSEQVFRAILDNIECTIPQRRRVSILFCDIRGFTSYTETTTPEEISSLLNTRYFTPLDGIICAHNGTLDKHIGDGVMGIFGAPLSFDDGAERAVLCALAMRKAIEEDNNKSGKQVTRIDIGIGIATGEVMAGIFGSHLKKEYTAFGPAVNLAARLEKAARPGEILVCGDTYDKVKKVTKAEMIAPLPLKGIQRKIDVYRIIATY